MYRARTARDFRYASWRCSTSTAPAERITRPCRGWTRRCSATLLHAEPRDPRHVDCIAMGRAAVHRRGLVAMVRHGHGAFGGDLAAPAADGAHQPAVLASVRPGGVEQCRDAAAGGTHARDDAGRRVRWVPPHPYAAVCQRRIKAMYPHTYTEITPLELLLSHHFFVSVYQSCNKVSVQLSRPVRLGSTNVNLVGSALNDILFFVCVLR